MTVKEWREAVDRAWKADNVPLRTGQFPDSEIHVAFSQHSPIVWAKQQSQLLQPPKPHFAAPSQHALPTVALWLVVAFRIIGVLGLAYTVITLIGLIVGISSIRPGDPEAERIGGWIAVELLAYKFLASLFGSSVFLFMAECLNLGIKIESKLNAP